MERPPQIPINRFQLAILLNEEEKQDYQLMLNENVFCIHCDGIAKKGISVTEIYMDSLNDIFVRGICNVCNGKVARTMEFGEDQAFYEKATAFRKAIGAAIQRIGKY